jgi:NAD(P)-dependent dehydrogenase (short-subunit alcohol dehydrogenase family)
MAPWLVIHNASVLPSRQPVWEESWDDTKRALSVNFESPLLFSSQLLPGQIKSNRGGGHLFISSGVGRRIRSGWGSYGMTKRSIEAISESIASDLPDPFFSATLNPGKMATKMRHFAYPLEDPETLPDPSLIAVEIAYFVKYLFESGGREINGAALEMSDIGKRKSPGRGHDDFS